ncbi:MAG TPA: helix-turn-helix domain-containing protein [Nocardioides sp.]|uniref:PucR family transcriptional regulator n=1 Tax=Nocardioides sp. TaxID=35761 RepID=UPI002BEC565E|nr:helix-turn-helix domain-containing protein [Nocardioides sp.]HQR26483.1 helix-turn-helix domain-containing protein [Nocardioides sp.]
MFPEPSAESRARAADALQRATGTLSTAATARMLADLAWFGALEAQERSWVGLIVQAGIRNFVDWYRRDAHTPAAGGSAIAASVFGAAPRALTGVISLQQTVDLIRLSIEVVESNVDAIVQPEDAPEVHQAISWYAREVAFATAEVYARAAEVRGAWDARLEALVVDSVLRGEADEAVLSRASALGWSSHGEVAVVLGPTPPERTASDLFDDVRRAARAAAMDALCAIQGERLSVVLGGVADPRRAGSVVADLFGEGAVVVGPVTADLGHAHVSARAALSAHRAAAGWPEAPRPCLSEDLLPERALAGDGHARRHLVEDVYLPLCEARGTLVTTLSTYFAQGSGVEATARALYVHPNTVRYRLRQATEVSGLSPADPRDGFTLRIALVLGRQSGRGQPGDL